MYYIKLFLNNTFISSSILTLNMQNRPHFILFSFVIQANNEMVIMIDMCAAFAFLLVLFESLTITAMDGKNLFITYIS